MPTALPGQIVRGDFSNYGVEEYLKNQSGFEHLGLDSMAGLTTGTVNRAQAMPGLENNSFSLKSAGASV